MGGIRMVPGLFEVGPDVRVTAPSVQRPDLCSCLLSPT